MTSLNDLAASAKALTNPEVVESTYGGYSGFTDPQSQTQGYRALPGGSLTSLGARILNSIDIVDMAFNYMDIEDQTCRMKTVCQAESYAVKHPVAKLAINTINSSFKGLEKYQHAIIAGQNGEDCNLLYDQCPFSYFGLKY